MHIILKLQKAEKGNKKSQEFVSKGRYFAIIMLKCSKYCDIKHFLVLFKCFHSRIGIQPTSTQIYIKATSLPANKSAFNPPSKTHGFNMVPLSWVGCWHGSPTKNKIVSFNADKTNREPESSIGYEQKKWSIPISLQEKINKLLNSSK